jgi:hypothetical protein
MGREWQTRIKSFFPEYPIVPVAFLLFLRLIAITFSYLNRQTSVQE